jgi:hypothetical protein
MSVGTAIVRRVITPEIALDFVLRARTKTYAAQSGQTSPLLPGAVQFEYEDGPWCYRDVYYLGNGMFSGLEAAFREGRPVFSMSYFGDFSAMSEEQADSLLKPNLLALWEHARTHEHVMSEAPDHTYVCAGQGSPAQHQGLEEIFVDGARVYWLRYTGGVIG